ncbi:tripartite tricarboxylate transporter permease [Microbacterium horticulturae]|uniref:Tripartite tricarboxylate transporter permease n=1 Tax=Microbacterium horticulturae TaxID=3028316 RepID=A0ABY8BVR4_9MICO|nr:tripartite tricarboxylate transporter permease [Microbacterium sp. KACC 23027]WEG08275.1 tripartite tricarboxylate transporter permease [Microbacterium sp. KACC 23027]
MTALLEPTLWALGMALLGAIVFALIGLVSGTDETATVAPLTLLVILLGVPPAGVFAFFMASIAAKHVTHAIPTTLLGIPGDTMAAPLLRDAQMLRELGVPHIALRKAISGGVMAALIAVPLAVLFAWIITPFSDAISAVAPWLFLAAAALIAVLSKGRWGALIALVPFVLIIVGLQQFSSDILGKGLSISFFLGIATGPLIADLVLASTPAGRRSMARPGPRVFELAADVRTWSGRMPNPAKVLDRTQFWGTAGAAAVSSATFVFSPVAMTVMMGELFGGRIKNGYRRLTTLMAVKNGTTESTYIAETLIPLIAIGLPLSPMAAGPANPLFNAPPVFTIDTETGATHNLHDLMAPWQFLGVGLLAVIIALLITYPFAMTQAHRAASWIMRHVSHEAIIGAFAGLIAVICLYEGGVVAILVAVTVGLVGGLMNRLFAMHTGVQFMGYYVAALTVPAIGGLFA